MMAKPYSDDLRRRILQSYERGEGTEEQLAQRFRVSYGYVKKLRRQQLRTGQMERIPHHPGVKPKFRETIRLQLRHWLQEQPDLTLAELQEKLRRQARLRVSLPGIWKGLRRMGLRLKKNRSTPRSKTAQRSSSSAKRTSRRLAPSKTGSGSS